MEFIPGSGEEVWESEGETNPVERDEGAEWKEDQGSRGRQKQQNLGVSTTTIFDRRRRSCSVRAH